MSRWDVVLYCTCGASLRLTASPAARTRTLAWWDAMHHGTGHQATTAAGARKGERDRDKRELAAATAQQETP